jgi:hypothetical protein
VPYARPTEYATNPSSNSKDSSDSGHDQADVDVQVDRIKIFDNTKYLEAETVDWDKELAEDLDTNLIVPTEVSEEEFKREGFERTIKPWATFI